MKETREVLLCVYVDVFMLPIKTHLKFSKPENSQKPAGKISRNVNKRLFFVQK